MSITFFIRSFCIIYIIICSFNRAFTPSGNSKINLTDYLNKVTGNLSENSANKNILKFGLGFILYKFYS